MNLELMVEQTPAMQEARSRRDGVPYVDRSIISVKKEFSDSWVVEVYLGDSRFDRGYVGSDGKGHKLGGVNMALPPWTDPMVGDIIRLYNPRGGSYDGMDLCGHPVKFRGSSHADMVQERRAYEDSVRLEREFWEKVNGNPAWWTVEQAKE